MRLDPPFVRAEVVETARRVALAAADHVDDIERDQRLPDDLVRLANDAELFRFYVKRSLGGPELDPFTAYRAVEELARVDGAFAWISMLSSTTSYLTTWLPDATVTAMRAVDGDLRLAGSSRPLGVAHSVPGGFRFSGRWDFGSGIAHATWVIAMCKVVDGEHAGQMRAMFVRPSDVEVIATWDVIGMRGTGSNDFTATDVFCPYEFTASFGGALDGTPLLYHPRLMRIVSQSPTAAINIGVSLGLLDAFADLAKSAATTSSPTVLRERRAVQGAFAEATGMIEAARALILDAMAEAWLRMVEGTGDPTDAIARTRLAFIHGARESMRAGQLLVTAAGTAGLFRAAGIERRVRDLHVARLFKAYDESIMEGAGRILLGLEPQGEGW